MEQWKTVEGYEGFYEVSDLGNVRAIERRVWKSDPNMRAGGCYIVRKAKPACTPTHYQGYIEARLCRKGKVRSFRVHRLVWEAFKGSIDDGYHIDHMDNDPSNNRLDNLQCLSPRDHKKVTLERTHEVKILEEYWDMEDGRKQKRGFAVHLSKAYRDGYNQALKDLQGVQ